MWCKNAIVRGGFHLGLGLRCLSRRLLCMVYCILSVKQQSADKPQTLFDWMIPEDSRRQTWEKRYFLLVLGALTHCVNDYFYICIMHYELRVKLTIYVCAYLCEDSHLIAFWLEIVSARVSCSLCKYLCSVVSDPEHSVHIFIKQYTIYYILYGYNQA